MGRMKMTSQPVATYVGVVQVPRYVGGFEDGSHRAVLGDSGTQNTVFWPRRNFIYTNSLAIQTSS